MPDTTKIPETKGSYQIITERLEKGSLEILFQMVIDSEGTTTFTVFKKPTAQPVEGTPNPRTNGG